MNPTDEYVEWKRKNPQVGCVFARLVATHPNRYGQSVEVVKSTDPKRIARSVAARIDRLMADPEVAGAVLVFPNVDSLSQLAQGLVQLQNHPGWTVGFKTIETPAEEACIAVGLSRDIPHGGNGTVPSEALVLGPFPEFPRTRQAPVPALEIFVGDPLVEDPKTGDPTTKANLAHIDVAGLPDATREKVWNASVAGRLESLGGVEDQRAKAKVAFVVPVELAEELGLLP